jgi:hypothetical protein
MSREKHTRPLADGRRGLWWTDRLWDLTADLPVERLKLADLAYPVIVCAEGRLMDGGHRLAKAWMEGRDDIAAVRFPVTPEPDEILPG